MDESAFNFVPAMPQFSSEAPALNFTIPYPVPRPEPVFGEISVLVIAVEFSDYNHTLSIEEVTNQTIGHLDAYYSQISYGAVSVVGKTVGWVRLPKKLVEYGADNGPFVDEQDGDGYPDTWKLLRDGAPLITNQINFAEYQHVLVIHAGYGQESSRAPNDIWSVTYIRRPVQTPQGTINRFAVVPEFEARGLGTQGVHTHEFGHLLGLPDLYSKTMEEVGPWDLMARGSWNGKPPGTSPAEMIAWNRIFLGWITQEGVVNVASQTRMNATIDPIEIPSSGVQAIKIEALAQGSKHYYLVEVRQRIGFDAFLPSTGVLITYMDETKSNPVKVIDAVQTTSTLDDAPFQVGQKYIDSENNLAISIMGTDGSSYSIVVDTMAPSPDVLVKDLTLNPPTVHPNSTASLNVIITNDGTLKTRSFLVNVYLNETLFASRKMSLDVGEVQEIQSSWTPTTGGTYVFKAVADAEKVLSESSKENNVRTLTVTVGYTLTLELRPPGAGGDIEWWLRVNGVNQTYTGIGEFRIGVLPGSNVLEIQRLIYLNPTSRYVFQKWSDGSDSNPRNLDVLSDISLSVDFSMQFMLSLEPNGGVASSGGWYDSGTPVTVSATSPSNVVEEQSRWVFLSWSGDIESNSTSIIINMTRSYRIAANWKTQYYLAVESPYTAVGEGWYDANTEAVISLTPTVTTDNGTRYLFIQWSGDVSGVEPSKPVIMSGPRFVSTVWTTQYELKIESEYGHTSGAGWYYPNTQAMFIVDALTIDATNATRHVFTKWSGDGAGTSPQGTILMDAPKVIRANWGTQYQVAFAIQGVRNGTILTMVVDGQPYQVKVPETIRVWRDAGSSVSFSTNATVMQFFRRYVLVDWSDSAGNTVKSPQEILKPERYVASYKELSLFPCVIATVTFGSEITPEVQFLRNFRDRLVLSTRAGSAFMSIFNMWYYSFSPQVADFIATHDTTRGPVRIGLYPLISILQVSSAAYSALASAPEFAVVTAGVVASALIGLVYLTPIDLFLFRFLLKKRASRTSIMKAASFPCLFASVTLLLGELTGSWLLLSAATSMLVLIVLVLTPFAFLAGLIRLCEKLELTTKLKLALSYLVGP